MYKRDIEKAIKKNKKFPVLAILGPRQSGKTTIAKKVFSKHGFVSFEKPEIRDFAENEPEKFLKANATEYGLVIDEFQYVPKILSYIQLDVDAHRRQSYFILTGSQNFLMNQAITQSLAGRVGILTLLPLSLSEMRENNLLSKNAEKTVFKGCYPRLYNESFKPDTLYSSYIHTYVERDVRQLVNVGDLGSFRKFLQMCAARVGNLVNFQDLSAACGISDSTARRWLSILQESYIVFLLEPYFENFNKRLTKMPKLYFYDTGLVCNLLRMQTPEKLSLDRLWGGVFESFIISDFMKQYYNAGLFPPLYFWSDKNGRLEVDCVIDDGGKLFPIEIKSSQNIVSDFFKGLRSWNELAVAAGMRTDSSQAFLVYGGDKVQQRNHGTAVPWQESGDLIEKIQSIL